MTTKKTTKKLKKTGKAGVPCGPSHEFDLERFKNMIIVALIAMIVGLTAAYALGVHNMRILINDARVNCEEVHNN